MKNVVKFPSFAERINAVQLSNMRHNAATAAKSAPYTPNRGDLLTEDPIKIEAQLLKRMAGKRRNGTQKQRRKLIRQNPHMMRSKKYSR